MNDAVRKIYIALLSKGGSGHFRIDEVEETHNKVALMKASSIANANGDIFPLKGDIYAYYKSYRVKMRKVVNPAGGIEVTVQVVGLYPTIMGFKDYLAGNHGSKC